MKSCKILRYGAVCGLAALAAVGCSVDDAETIRVRECDNPFLLQFVAALFFGVDYEYIGEERLLVAEQKDSIGS